MARVPDRPNVQVVQLSAGPATDETVQADASQIIAALIRADIDLFNIEDSLYAVDSGNLILVSGSVLREIVRRSLVTKQLAGHDGTWSVAHVPVELDERVMRIILTGKDPRFGGELKGGPLRERVPKAVRQPATIA